MTLISLYPIVVIIGFVVRELFTRGYRQIFMMMIYVGLILSHLSVLWTKRWVTSPRPDEAKDCDLLNSGGSAKGENGFPSGHTTFATFIFVCVAYLYTRHVHSSLGLVVLTGLFCILMPFERVHNKCHTVPQVLGGVGYGLFWGGLYLVMV